VARHVVPEGEHHQGHEHQHAHLLDHLAGAQRERRALHTLHHEHQGLAAVQHGDRQQVEDPEVDADQDEEPQVVVPAPLHGQVRLTADLDGAADVLARDLPGDELAEAAQEELRRLHREPHRPRQRHQGVAHALDDGGSGEHHLLGGDADEIGLLLEPGSRLDGLELGRHARRLGLPVAREADRERTPLAGAHGLGEGREAPDGLAVHGEDQVARLEASAGGRPILEDLRDQDGGDHAESMDVAEGRHLEVARLVVPTHRLDADRDRRGLGGSRVGVGKARPVLHRLAGHREHAVAGAQPRQRRGRAGLGDPDHGGLAAVVEPHPAHVADQPELVEAGALLDVDADRKLPVVAAHAQVELAPRLGADLVLDLDPEADLAIADGEDLVAGAQPRLGGGRAALDRAHDGGGPVDAHPERAHEHEHRQHQVHRGPREHDEQLLPGLLRAEGLVVGGTRLGRVLVAGLLAEHLHEAPEGDPADHVLGPAPLPAHAVAAEADRGAEAQRELQDPNAAGLGGEEVAELVDGDQDAEQQREGEDPAERA
jgi:hypothetical protein